MSWGQKGNEPILIERGRFVSPKNIKKNLLHHEVDIKLRSAAQTTKTKKIFK